METPKVVSHEQWLKARIELLAAERELTHQRDALVRRRMAMPWERVEKRYVFDAPEGRRTLAELFEGRRQLLVQHFMLGPGWEEGCKSCSFMADHTDGMNVHLAQRDVTFVAISRAPLAGIERFRKRMGWRFKWVSSHGGDFNYDFHVSFTPEEKARNKVYYNYGEAAFRARRVARHQRVLQGRRRRSLSYLLDLRARRGGHDGHIQPPGPDSEGARRGPIELRHGMGASPRSLRAGAGRWFVLRSARLREARGERQAVSCQPPPTSHLPPPTHLEKGERRKELSAGLSHSPGRRPLSDHAPMLARTSRRVVWPAPAVMRRTCRLRPSAIVASRHAAGLLYR